MMLKMNIRGQKFRIKPINTIITDRELEAEVDHLGKRLKMKEFLTKSRDHLISTQVEAEAGNFQPENILFQQIINAKLKQEF